MAIFRPLEERRLAYAAEKRGSSKQIKNAKVVPSGECAEQPQCITQHGCFKLPGTNTNSSIKLSTKGEKTSVSGM